jgi:hypothetical protein
VSGPGSHHACVRPAQEVHGRVVSALDMAATRCGASALSMR